MTPAHAAGSRKEQLLAWVRRLRGPLAAIAAVGAVLSGLVGYWNAYRTVSESVAPGASRTGAPATTPQSNSFAVLPFSASTSDPVEGQLAETLTADLTSTLQRGMPDWSVVSHGLAAKYKGKAIDARTVGSELKVRYLLEGVSRSAGGRGEVRVRLTDTSTGNELWSDGIELETAADAKTWQVSVARLTNQVRSVLYDAEARDVLARAVPELNARELTVRADTIQRRDPKSLSVVTEARSLYDKALRLDPDLSTALMGKALAVAEALERDPSTDHDRLVREYDEASARLVGVAEREARAWNIRADALERQWRWEAALEANARAQKIDPTRANTLGQRATILISMGQPLEALSMIERGFSLRPTDARTESYLWTCACWAHLALGHYDDSIAACEKASSLFDDWWPHAFLAAAYALRGNQTKAVNEKAKLLALRQGFSIEAFKAQRLSDVPAYLQQTENHLFAGLRKAGVPETQPSAPRSGSPGRRN